jgi:hypothetical protein
MKSLLFIFLLISSLSYAEINKFNSAWFEVGAGIAPKTFKQHSGISLGLGICSKLNNNILTLRFVKNIERNIGGPTPTEQIDDFSILWGQNISGDKYRNILPLVGLGLISYTKRSKFLDTGTINAEFDKSILKTLGISLGLKMFSFSKTTCFGFYLLSNINNKNSYFAVQMCLGFGNMF